MYVMVVARGYPTERYKMNGIFEFDQAKALADLGHKVVYAAVDVRSVLRWRRWGIERKNTSGVEIYAINIPGGRVPTAMLHRVRTTGLSMLYGRIVREQGRPDVMHAHFPFPSYAASQLKDRTGVPLVVTEHLSAMMEPEISPRICSAANAAYENADALIAVSPGLQKVLEMKFGKKSVYIPNIVDTELFSCGMKERDGKFRFIAIGALIPRKRMDLTVDAFARAFGRNQRVTLTIFGEGPERAKLEETIRRNSLEERVTLMGLRSRDEIAGHLKAGDCFVLASRAETFGVVYAEAMAAGLPVIATKCGGPEHFVNKENGLLIPVDDLEDLVSAMKYMYENIDSYDRRAISRTTADQFSARAVGKQLEHVYEKVVGRE